MVYKLATKINGEVFAVKQLEKRKFMKDGILDHKVDNELKIIKHLRHVSAYQDLLFLKRANIASSPTSSSTSTMPISLRISTS